MYDPGTVTLAVPLVLAAAYGARMHARAAALTSRLDSDARRHSEVLEAVRVLSAASRESTDAVLTALDRTLRVLQPAIDAVLVFVPQGHDLTCVFAAGARTEHFTGIRLRRDEPASLPARAALCGHRVFSAAGIPAIMPGDRAAIAVPMEIAGAPVAVLYASAQQPVADWDPVVRAAGQAAAPYSLAAERESDRRSATYDGLTGLYTPRAFRMKLQEEVAAASLKRYAPIALWFVDTDRFKHINDTYGHAAGDAVLQRMAALLREHTVPSVDIAARNGGDEFCAILRNTHKVRAIERAQHFCEAVREHDFGHPVALTASVGVAAYPEDAADASRLLELADAAMYHSKRSGRDRVSFAVDANSFAAFS